MTPTPTELEMLTEQFQKLALQVKELQTETAKATTTSRPCLYCDRQGHTKRQCELLTQDLRTQIVHINHHRKLTNLSGEVYRLNTGKGGIRILATTATVKSVRSEPVQPVTSTVTATIHQEEAPAAAFHDKIYYIHRSEVNSSDLPRIGRYEYTVGRVIVEVDPVRTYSDNELPRRTIGTYARSEKTEERPAATHLVGATSSTIPIAMENAIEKQSTAEEGLAAGQIGDSGLSMQEVTHAGRRLCPVAEGFASTPTDIETLSTTIRAPDKVNTIPCDTWKERPHLCPRTQENKILTSSEERRCETCTIAEMCLPPSGILPRGSNENPLRQAIDTNEAKKDATQECYERGGEHREKIREKNKVTFGNSRRAHKAPLEISDWTQKCMIVITNQEEQVVTNRWVAPYEIAEAHGSGSDSFADLVRTPSQSLIAGYRLKDFFIRASASPDSSSAREDVVGIGNTAVPQGDRSSAEGQWWPGEPVSTCI
ncbi:hypothetical protein EV182_004833 [Spiromyces aspiralis]|uniref:Uncharacterized protein n=1 Tax=Spiromyces aspiralis TaxID=68401 RepID=A0ACC1HE40_9FUNG|nr:hypothetical protein EV182_004833 [Spiromyces aspiralis]